MTIREHLQSSASLFGSMASECNWPRLWMVTVTLCAVALITIYVTLR